MVQMSSMATSFSITSGTGACICTGVRGDGTTETEVFSVTATTCKLVILFSILEFVADNLFLISEHETVDTVEPAGEKVAENVDELAGCREQSVGKLPDLDVGVRDPPLATAAGKTVARLDDDC